MGPSSNSVVRPVHVSISIHNVYFLGSGIAKRYFKSFKDHTFYLYMSIHTLDYHRLDDQVLMEVFPRIIPGGFTETLLAEHLLFLQYTRHMFSTNVFFLIFF